MGRAEYRRIARAIKAGKAHMTPEGAISEAQVIDRRRQEAILLHVVEPEPGFVPGAYRNDLAGYVAFMEDCASFLNRDPCRSSFITFKPFKDKYAAFFIIGVIDGFYKVCV